MPGGGTLYNLVIWLVLGWREAILLDAMGANATVEGVRANSDVMQNNFMSTYGNILANFITVLRYELSNYLSNL